MLLQIKSDGTHSYIKSHLIRLLVITIIRFLYHQLQLGPLNFDKDISEAIEKDEN